MEYYTLLTIFYEVAQHDLQFSIWLPSYDACWNVILNENTIYKKINGTAAFCDVSTTLSKVVKPPIRPW